jgi:hypothetical protein
MPFDEKIAKGSIVGSPTRKEPKEDRQRIGRKEESPRGKGKTRGSRHAATGITGSATSTRRDAGEHTCVRYAEATTR